MTVPFLAPLLAASSGVLSNTTHKQDYFRIDQKKARGRSTQYNIIGKFIKCALVYLRKKVVQQIETVHEIKGRTYFLIKEISSLG